MLRILAAMLVTEGVLVVASGITGPLVTPDDQRMYTLHFLLGFFTTVFTCFVHCVVFTYFIATGKMIKLAVEEASLPAELHESSRQMKAAALRVALIGIVAIIVNSWSGAWATQTIAPLQAVTHLVVAAIAVVANGLVFWTYWHRIAAHGRLIDDVFARHEATGIKR